jgi:ABC-type phosphate/phosphonate transport system permease subunit
MSFPWFDGLKSTVNDYVAICIASFLCSLPISCASNPNLIQSLWVKSPFLSWLDLCQHVEKFIGG